MKHLRSVLIGIGVLLLVAGSAGVWFVRRPWPEVSGTLKASGLQAPVQVVRDQWGVPHIYAENEHDLFLAQGYVHAQDRLWQMEFNRRVGTGTLSEVLGKGVLDTDQFVRVLGFPRVAQRQWDALDSRTRALMEAYSAGVNAYIDSHSDRLPLEFTILGHRPQPWRPTDSLAYGTLLTYSLSGNYRLELLRARLIAKVGEDGARQLLLPYGDDMPLIIPPEARGYQGLGETDSRQLEALDNLLGDPGPIWGSNNWVVHGSRTASGKPLLANDTHMAMGMPSLWYENGLHGGRFNSVGMTFPGVPLVVTGHNARIAWGMSNLNPDTQDLYIEKFDNPTSPTKYEYQGGWRDLEVVTETIAIKNQPALEMPVYRTHHGPIITDMVRDKLDAGYNEPLALRWAALENSSLIQSIIEVNQAGSWQEFRDAIKHWEAPGQNFVYADVDGNIGYQSSGNIPIRAAGHQGVVPVPGWTGEYEWQRSIPFEELPSSFNPPAGFIATANNKIVDDSYPYSISPEWDPGYRARRITDLLAANSSMTVDGMRYIHADTYSLPAEALRPFLLAVAPEGEAETRALEAVKNWDLRFETDRVGASVYQAWYWFVVRNSIDDDLGEQLAATYLGGQYERHGSFQVPLTIDLMKDPNNPWFDITTTPEVENRDAIARKSLADAVAWLTENFGADQSRWNWGRLHTISFTHAPLGQSGIGILERLFNGGPNEARGDNFTVNAASFGLDKPFKMIHGSSQRHIVDLADFDSSLGVTPTGQSGQLFHPHRGDLIGMWQQVEYHPMLFGRERVEAGAADTLTLTP